jgi:hypothetical protein
MKQKIIYIGILLILGGVIFIVFKKEREANISLGETIEKDSSSIQKFDTSIPAFSNEEERIIVIKSIEELKSKELLGSYWNHSETREEGVEDGDEVINLSINRTNTLEIYFEAYMPRVDADGDVEIVARYDCFTTLAQLSETTFLIDEEEYCLEGQNKLCFIKVEEQVGVSFDGKTIAYYKEQK